MDEILHLHTGLTVAAAAAATSHCWSELEEQECFTVLCHRVADARFKLFMSALHINLEEEEEEEEKITALLVAM